MVAVLKEGQPTLTNYSTVPQIEAVPGTKTRGQPRFATKARTRDALPSMVIDLSVRSMTNPGAGTNLVTGSTVLVSPISELHQQRAATSSVFDRHLLPAAT
jgi:hypothetical protein